MSICLSVGRFGWSVGRSLALCVCISLALSISFSGNYMHRLAEEIGAAPTFSKMLRRSFKVSFTYAMGQVYTSMYTYVYVFIHVHAHVPFFTLQGTHHVHTYTHTHTLIHSAHAHLCAYWCVCERTKECACACDVCVCLFPTQAMIPFFKLQGPYACEHAWSVCEDEMWHTIVRRGLPENVALVLMVSGFGLLNAAVWAADAALSLASFGRFCICVCVLDILCICRCYCHLALSVSISVSISTSCSHLYKHTFTYTFRSPTQSLTCTQTLCMSPTHTKATICWLLAVHLSTLWPSHFALREYEWETSKQREKLISKRFTWVWRRVWSWVCVRIWSGGLHPERREQNTTERDTVQNTAAGKD